jgi:hypothetical protein
LKRIDLRVALGRTCLAISVFLIGLFSMIGAFDIMGSFPKPVGHLDPRWIMIPLGAYADYFLVGFVALAGIGVFVALGRRLPATVCAFLFAELFWISFFVLTPDVKPVVNFSITSGSYAGLVEDSEALYYLASALLFFFVSQMLLTKKIPSALARTLVLTAAVAAAFTGAIILLTPAYAQVHITSFQSDFFGLNLDFVTNEFVFVVTAPVVLAAFSITMLKRTK